MADSRLESVEVLRKLGDGRYVARAHVTKPPRVNVYAEGESPEAASCRLTAAVAAWDAGGWPAGPHPEGATILEVPRDSTMIAVPRA